jgi:hypothetical protein
MPGVVLNQIGVGAMSGREAGPQHAGRRASGDMRSQTDVSGRERSPWVSNWLTSIGFG